MKQDPKQGKTTMLEIRFHGRGGQGTVVASVLLAKAFFADGYYVQTFPLFGVERRGAPVEAFLRLDREKILIRSNIYAPDHILVQDIKLLTTTDVTRGIKKGGWILINSGSVPENPGPFKGFRLAYLDASRLAVEQGLGTRTHPIINTAMVGAFSRVLEKPSLDAVLSAIEKEIPVKPEQNIRAAQNAFEQVRLHGPIED
jgi:pyruvate ferredoxin oxidoreductase gamma subunit/2-oxoisovalerate ferredoxin oxidoreductase gamma subunit